MENKVKIIFCTTIDEAIFENVAATHFYLKYNKIMLVFLDGSTKVISDVDEIEAGSDISCVVIAD